MTLINAISTVMVNSNGHIQVYNERQSNQKNIIVSKIKTTVAFLYFC